MLGLIVACGSAGTSDLDEPGSDEDVGVSASPLPKGTPGAVNGDGNYCNDPLELCEIGEGDCDASSQCFPGNVCGLDNGPNFGHAVGSDVCVPPHCENGRLDGDETQVDCGGSCGTTCGPPVCELFPVGHPNWCTGGPCTCGIGEGDCDMSSECEAGLVCGRNNGPKFGFAEGSDACVPAHCDNNRLDGDETQVDCGGSCGAICGPPVCEVLPVGDPNWCTGGPCTCGVGEGDCDLPSDCAPGLICGLNNGPRFGFVEGSDACIPPECENGVQDANETAVDCGGDCGTVGCPAACVVGTVYDLTIAGDVGVLVPRPRQPNQCVSISIPYSRTLQAIIREGAVEIVGDGFSGLYPATAQTLTSITAQDGGADFACGFARVGETSGLVTIAIDCAANTATFSATCEADIRRDQCAPNIRETATGSGASSVAE